MPRPNPLPLEPDRSIIEFDDKPDDCPDHCRTWDKYHDWKDAVAAIDAADQCAEDMEGDTCGLDDWGRQIRRGTKVLRSLLGQIGHETNA